MNVWELERWRSQAELLQLRGKAVSTVILEKAFHSMGYPQDLDYHNSLVTWASEATSAGQGVGKDLPHVWDESEYWYRSQMAAIKKAYADLREEKHDVTTLKQLGFDYQKHKEEQELEKQRTEVEAEISQ